MATYGDLPAEFVTEQLRMRRWLPSDAERGNSIWMTRVLDQP